MEKSPDAFRTITEVSKWLETPAHVLRFWESRFPEVSPVKRAGGRRYYRPEDMRILGGIKTMLHDQGKSIKDVQDLLADQGADGIAALSPELILDAPDGNADTSDAAPSRLNLLPDSDAESHHDTPGPSPSDIEGIPEPDLEPNGLDHSDESLKADSDADEVQALDEDVPPETTEPDLFGPSADAAAPNPDGFQSRRTRHSKPKTEDAEPIRGFFFNDMSEPALPSEPPEISLDLDRDDPSNYLGFSALNDPGLGSDQKDERDSEADAPEQDTATIDADDDETAAPVTLTPLPKDPEEPDLSYPGLPTIAAELRSIDSAEWRQRMPRSAIQALALRLETLRERSQDA